MLTTNNASFLSLLILFSTFVFSSFFFQFCIELFILQVYYLLKSKSFKSLRTFSGCDFHPLPAQWLCGSVDKLLNIYRGNAIAAG